MIREMEEVRHAQERGAILSALKYGYEMEMVSFGALANALSLVGQPMTRQGMQFSLSLLADSGYIRIWRAKDMPNWRVDRAGDVRPEVILFARLLPRGLQLIDGHIASDPYVSF